MYFWQIPLPFFQTALCHVIGQLVSGDIQKAGNYFAQIDASKLCNVLTTVEKQFLCFFTPMSRGAAFVPDQAWADYALQAKSSL